MSRHGEITFDWADGTYLFRIPWGGIEELETVCNMGARAILRAFINGDEKARWVREVYRIGLIGGGTSPADALRLVRTYIEERGLIENIEGAYRILAAALYGPEDDMPKVPKADAAETTQPNASSLPQ